MDHVPVVAVFILLLPLTVLGSHLPPPVNLTMDSRYFVHLITWQAGPGSPEGLRYTVKVRSLSQSWKTVENCVKVKSPLSCNLTDVFPDPRETYYINVTAILGDDISTPTSYQPFNPVEGTTLAPPLLKVLPCNKSLCVDLQSPSQRLNSLYERFRFSLNVTSERGDSFVVNTKGLNTVLLKDLSPDLRYCVSVRVKDRPAYNSAVCASTTAEHNLDWVIYVGCLLVVLMCAAALMASGSVCMKTHPPYVLSSFQSPYVVQLLVLHSVEFLTCVLEANLAGVTAEKEKDEETDQDKEDEHVAYERRQGCELVPCNEVVSEAVLAQYTPETQHEDKSKPFTESHNAVSQNPQQGQEIARLDWQPKPPESTTPITSALSVIPLEPKDRLNSFDILKVATGDQERPKEQEEREVNVNFFSLTLRGHREELHEETEEEKDLVHVQKIEPEAPSCSLSLEKTTMHDQPTASELSNRHFLPSDEEEEEEDEEEDYSGYMGRN